MLRRDVGGSIRANTMVHPIVMGVYSTLFPSSSSSVVFLLLLPTLQAAEVDVQQVCVPGFELQDGATPQRTLVLGRHDGEASVTGSQPLSYPHHRQRHHKGMALDLRFERESLHLTSTSDHLQHLLPSSCARARTMACKNLQVVHDTRSSRTTQSSSK